MTKANFYTALFFIVLPFVFIFTVGSNVSYKGVSAGFILIIAFAITGGLFSILAIRRKEAILGGVTCLIVSLLEIYWALVVHFSVNIN